MSYTEEELVLFQNEIKSGTTIPDLNRAWLLLQSEKEKDPERRMLYEALLEGYDSGGLNMQYNPWSGEMEYSQPDIN